MKREQTKQSSTYEKDIGRIMPQARELEEAVLGAVLIEKSAFEIVNDILTPEMFYDKSNELIFKACAELDSEKKPIDLLTVVERLRKNETLETIGGVTRIAKLSQAVVSSAHLEYHCLVVKDKYLHRRLIEICSEYTAFGFDDTEDIDDTIAKLNTEIERIQECIAGSGNTIHISDAVKKSVEAESSIKTIS